MFEKSFPQTVTYPLQKTVFKYSLAQRKTSEYSLCQSKES